MGKMGREGLASSVFLIKTIRKVTTRPDTKQHQHHRHHHGHLARTVLLVNRLLSLGATQTFSGQGWLQGWLLLTPLLSLPPKWSPPPPRAMGAGFFLPTQISWKPLGTRAVLVEARSSPSMQFYIYLIRCISSHPTLYL